MNPAVQEALQKVTAEEKRLLAKLAEIKSVKVMLMKANAIKPRKSANAPAGGLKAAILSVLGASPMSNGDIRAALLKDGYTHSLSPIHVTKNLIALHRAKKVKRTGTKAATRYTLAK